MEGFVSLLFSVVSLNVGDESRLGIPPGWWWGEGLDSSTLLI